MKYIIYLMFGFSLLFQSCTETHSHSEVAEVTTNDGQPWEANPETSAGIEKMQTILSEYSETEITETTGAELKKALEHEFQEIFRQCTMKGEAHNQLHNYLFPMKALFEKIGEADKTAITALNEHLTNYKTYFK